MKKILLTMFMALTAVFAIAQTKTYTDVLQVIINGQGATPQEATIQVEKVAGGSYSLSLKNFMLDGIAVGNIVLTDIAVDEANGIRSFSTKQNINITEGEDASQSWLGPMLGEVPVDLKGKMTDGKLYCSIDIDMSAILGQTIAVVFGTDIKSVAAYTDNLVVTINGASSEPQPTTISVTEGVDGKYTLSLNNFMLETIAVGNIVLTGISVDEANGIKNFSTKQNINITEGEDASQSWIGPMLGEVPVDLKGKMTADKLYCTIDIDMSGMLGQVINVVFGNDITSGISAVKGDAANAVIYDLTGRRIDAITAPGVYIVNGKKQLVK
ncbi:MAG: calycin-like domain-containing protein [Bacteroidaceae bacterium]|nr:calycin-like domain-containing protein [Bacteroidaceae bacterium]